MDIAVTPDTYTPSVDDFGNYCDYIPDIRHGLLCPCGSRKNKVFENSSKFSIHSKSKAHQKWLSVLNQNKANYYVNLIKCNELVDSQKKIIANLENNLHRKTLTIDYLTEQLAHNVEKNNKRIQPTCTMDLLDFN